MSGSGSANKGSQFYSVVAQDIELTDGDLAQDMNRNTYQINMSKFPFLKAINPQHSFFLNVLINRSNDFKEKFL